MRASLVGVSVVCFSLFDNNHGYCFFFFDDAVVVVFD